MNEEIIICDGCAGEGIIHCSELKDCHHGTYKYYYKKCKKCEGSGRMRKTTTITTGAYIPKTIKEKEEK